MTTGESPGRTLLNETRINVAALLQEPVGSSRSVHLHLDSLVLDDDLVASDLNSDVRLIRLQHHLLAIGEIRAELELECVRCLDPFRHQIRTPFSEQFLQTHDVRSGAEVSEERKPADQRPIDEEDQPFLIDEGHELDLLEAIRQNIIVDLPMMPVCGEDCPGPPDLGAQEAEPRQEQRFDVLAQLLDDNEDDDNDT